MLDLERELRYPLHDERWLKKVLIGGVLNILPVICFFSWGYAYRIFRQTLLGNDVVPLPPWNRWKDDFIKGFIILVLALCWAVIPYILLKVHPLLGMLAVAAAAVLFPMTLAFYAAEERFVDAFRVKHIWQRVYISRDVYARAWLACGVLLVVGLFIWRLPVIGYPVGAFLFFYILLVYARLFGLAGRSMQSPSRPDASGTKAEENASPPAS